MPADAESVIWTVWWFIRAFRVVVTLFLLHVGQTIVCQLRKVQIYQERASQCNVTGFIAHIADILFA